MPQSQGRLQAGARLPLLPPLTSKDRGQLGAWEQRKPRPHRRSPSPSGRSRAIGSLSRGETKKTSSGKRSDASARCSETDRPSAARPVPSASPLLGCCVLPPKAFRARGASPGRGFRSGRVRGSAGRGAALESVHRRARGCRSALCRPAPVLPSFAAAVRSLARPSRLLLG